MADAMKLIALSDDVTIVRSLEQLHALLSEAPMQSLESVEKEVVVKADGSPDIVNFLSLIREASDRSLSPMDSVRAARWLLTMLADRDQSKALVVHCIENEPKDRLKVGTVLTVGLVGAVWIWVATTDFSYADGKIEVHKAALEPEQIKLSAEILKGKLELALNANDRGKSSASGTARTKKR
ncbi:hypothetical protein [Caballeronia sp. RCC_10]|uniref:hypothetical protein n=1 Tax=Caballeronia sp. RCC_10 TaxID=3239227 RepID=UPI003525D81F